MSDKEQMTFERASEFYSVIEQSLAEYINNLSARISNENYEETIEKIKVANTAIEGCRTAKIQAEYLFGDRVAGAEK